MVKKSRIKFIINLMLIALTTFALIFGVTCFLLKNSFKNKITEQLSSVSYNYLKNNTVNDDNYLIVSASSKGNFVIICGENNFSYTQIITITEKGLNFDSGKLDNIIFKSFENSGDKLIVAIDCNQSLQYIKTIQKNVLIALVIIYLVFGLVISAFSIKVFRPMQESLFRQKEFLSNAGHELKTPLTIISASADVLAKNSDNEYVENIKAQSKRLEFLINDMLTLAQIDEEKFTVNKENTNVSNLILECALPFEETAFLSGKTYILDVQENINKHIDAKALKTIVDILLDNAFKYSSDNGTIKIGLKQTGNNTVFSVFNTGSLIPSELSGKIFERFYRGEGSRSRDYGGNGLGLSIAKNVCALNGWKIKANSVYGTSMTLTLEI